VRFGFLVVALFVIIQVFLPELARATLFVAGLPLNDEQPSINWFSRFQMREAKWKEVAGEGFPAREREPAMLRAEVRITFTVVYRGYAIEVSRGPIGWCAGVYPRSANLPILYRNEVQASDQDETVIEAMDRIDRVLRHST
jgi:hypothetical protein